MNKQYNDVTTLHTVLLAVFNLSTRILTKYSLLIFFLTNLLFLQWFKVIIFFTKIEQYLGKKVVDKCTWNDPWPAAVSEPFLAVEPEALKRNNTCFSFILASSGRLQQISEVYSMPNNLKNCYRGFDISRISWFCAGYPEENHSKNLLQSLR